jgi:hypothetical protein
MTRQLARWTKKAFSWWGSRRGSGRSRAVSRSLLYLEVLEDRCVPSTITPTTFADGVLGSGSLRDAVLQFNADAGSDDDTIQLLAGTYALTIVNTGGIHETAGLQGDLNITNTSHRLIIQGAGSSTIIDASQLQDRVFQIVNPGTQVVFQDLVITGGLAQDDGSNGALAGTTDALGGGILNNGGNITLDHVVIQNNVARGGDAAVPSAPGHNASGGGFYSTGGALTISGATITNNQAIGGRGGDHNGSNSGGHGGSGGGGGLYATGGFLDISDSMIASNRATGGRGGDGYVSQSRSMSFGAEGGSGGAGQGGGLYVNGSSLTIATSTIASNQGTDGSPGTYGVYGGDGLGGGLYNSGTLTVSSSTLSGNSVSVYDGGGGIYNGGTLTVSNSTLSGNTGSGGGGIFNYNSATLTVSNSTLSGNSSVGGGGIYNTGTLTVSNSTLSGNSATWDSGGIYTDSTRPVTLTNVTLTANRANTGGGSYHGGGLFVTGGGAPVLHNTLIAGNFRGATGTTRDDVSGALNAGGDYNLIGDGTGMTGLSNGINGNLVGSAAAPIDPLLGPLQDNGGPTFTHALLSGSAARGAGSLSYATATDQRGLPRVVVGQIDQGAYQSQSAPAGPQVVLSDPDGLVDPPVDHVRVTFNHPIDLTTFTTAQASLSGPGGSIALTGVTFVASTNNQQFDLAFGSQVQPGDYALVVSAAVRDIYGNPLDNPSTLRFILPGLTGSILTVNSTADTANPTDPYLTLREAITIVNSPTLPTGLSPQILAQISDTLHAHGSDTIIFDTTQVSTPIRLGGTQLELSLHSSRARITIDGGSGVTVDGNYRSRILQVDSGAQATLDHLTITHGREAGGGGVGGGGIYNGGTLTVSNSTLSGNSSTSYAGGGGIYNRGTLTVSNSTLSGNSAGGAGGIANLGTLMVSNSTLSGNSATDSGGNSGGIYNSGTLTVSNSTLSGNSATDSGGGILNNGTLTVSNTTLSGNSAGGGGGITNNGTLTVSNTTLSGNSATEYYGGGILNAYGTLPVTLTNVTLTGNRASRGGGGLTFYSGAPVLHNTLIAGNFRGATGTTRDDVSGALNPGGDYSLIGDGTGMTGLSNGVHGNLVGSAAAPIDPLLGPLQDNGGPTLTHALLPGSPAVDAGNNAYATDWDQRGEGFPRIVNGTIDIGAFEYQGGGGSPGRTTPPGGEAFRLDVAALLSPAAPDRASFFSLTPALVPVNGAWPGPDVAVVDRLFASLNKEDGSFALSQSMRQAPAEADSWALDPESGDGPLLVYARVLTE